MPMSEKIVAEPIFDPILDLCTAWAEKTGADAKLKFHVSFIDDPPIPDKDGNLWQARHAGPQWRIEITLTDLSQPKELAKAYYTKTDHRGRELLSIPARAYLYEFQRDEHTAETLDSLWDRVDWNTREIRDDSAAGTVGAESEDGNPESRPAINDQSKHVACSG